MKERSKSKTNKRSFFAHFVVPIVFVDLLPYPYNYLLILMVFEVLLIALYLYRVRKKPAEAVSDEVAVETNQGKIAGKRVNKGEVIENKVVFSKTSGLFKKQSVNVEQIPLSEIKKADYLENSIAITTINNVTKIFVLARGQSFGSLCSMINLCINEAQKLEEQKNVSRHNDSLLAVNKTLTVLDRSFDLLMELHMTPIIWNRFESQVNASELNLSFPSSAFSILPIDYSSVSLAVKSHSPKGVADETFNILASIFSYFEGIKTERDETPLIHPNVKDIKNIVLSYYLLNDIIFGILVGEKTTDEYLALEESLKKLANEANKKIDPVFIVNSIEKLNTESFQTVVKQIRALFKDFIETAWISRVENTVENTSAELS